jgi:hypothetical protein
MLFKNKIKFVYTPEDLQRLALTINKELLVLFVKTGIEAQIFSDSIYIHQVSKFPDDYSNGVWQFVIDVNTYKLPNGLDLLPTLTTDDISNDIILNKFANFPFIFELNTPRWSNVTWFGGRLVFIIFSDGLVKRVPSTHVSYVHSIDSINAGEIIHNILKQHYEIPAIRTINRTELIKMELVAKYFI